MPTTDPTRAYYETNAAAFVAGTVDANMGELLGAFCKLLPDGARVLDWGCGSGRDSLAMRERGFAVTSTDASAAMCAEALRATGTHVRQEGFLELAEGDAYEGIWASASLLHLRRDELPNAFAIAHRALVTDGVFYCSFKLGNSEGVSGGRWFTCLDEPALHGLLGSAGFEVVRIWTTHDVRPSRSSELWLNCLARRG